MDWNLDVDHLHAAIEAWWAGRHVHEAEGVHVGEVIERLRQRADDAGGLWQFAATVRESLVELGDGHLRLANEWPVPDMQISSGLQIADTTEGVTVCATPPGTPARAGDVVVAVDQQPLEDYLASVRCTPGSTVAHRRWQAAMSLVWQQRLPDEPPPARAITVAGTGGQGEIPLTWTPIASDTPTPHCVTGGKIDPDLGVVTVRSFVCRDELGQISDVEFRRQLLAAASAVTGAADVIIDLRGNGGGRDQQARMLASSCIEQPITWMRFRHRSSGIDNDIETETVHPVAAPPFAASRLWIATGIGTMSTAEIFAAAVGSAGSATLVGTATAGSTGNPVRFRLPRSGLGIDIPVSEYFAPGGGPIEGSGLTPDLRVPTSPIDLQRGIDPVIEAVRSAR